MIAELGVLFHEVKASSDIAKNVLDSIATMDREALRQQISILVANLEDLRINSHNLQEILNKKDDRIKELEFRLVLKEELTFKKPFYFFKSGENKIDPLCPVCVDLHNQTTHLEKVGEKYRCPKCASAFPLA